MTKINKGAMQKEIYLIFNYMLFKRMGVKYAQNSLHIYPINRFYRLSARISEPVNHILQINIKTMAEHSAHLKPLFDQTSFKSKRKVDFVVEDAIYPQEVIPGNEMPTERPIRRKIEIVENHQSQVLHEDPRKSRFSHSRLMAIEKISCLLTTLIFFLSCTKTEMDIQSYDSEKISSNYLMNTISACTAALVIVIFLRYITKFQLEFDQNKIYLKKSPKQSWTFLFFTKSESLKYLFFEILVILPHPVAVLHGKTFVLFQTYDQVYLNHSYNDILSLLLIAKIYIVVRAIINISTFSSPRATRLCYQNGFQHNLLYVVKCLLNESPLSAIAVNFVGMLMVFGYALKLSEGVLFLYNAGLSTGFESYANCFWCTFITMATVGYGDYYPKTLPGRAIILITAISGVLLSSLLIVSLSLYLQMIPSQSKSHITLLRLGEQQHLAKEASTALTETVKVQQLVGRPQGYKEDELRIRFQKLKKDIDAAKLRSRKIKSLVDTDNIIEEMNRSFYILKDNLKDIFIGQMKLRDEIGKIEQIQSIKLSFIREVEEMLSKASFSRKSSLDPNLTPPADAPIPTEPAA